MWVFDVVTLSFLEVNQSAIEIYGYSREEFLCMSLKDIRPEDDIEALETHVAKISPIAKSDKRWRHIKKDGTCIWVTVASFEVLFNGKLARLATITDVTKYREQELAIDLANSELKEYKKAVTTSSLVSITNRAGIIEYANENFAVLTGYSQQELVGSNHNIVNSGYHPHSFWQNMWNTVMKGVTWRGEVCNRKKNGELYWVDSFIIPVSNDNGRIERIFSIRIDITERKKKETEVVTLNRQLVAINLELAESKIELEKLSLVATLTSSQVFILDKDRRIIWANDAFVRLTGYSREESYGKLPENLLHGPDSPPETTSLIKEAIKNRQPFHTEVTHYTKSGKKLFLVTDGQPVFDTNGSLLQYVIVETDITEMKEKQEAIRNSETKLNAFFSTTANLHLLIDQNLRVLAFNKVAEQFISDIMHQKIAMGDYLPDKLAAPLRENFVTFAQDALAGNAAKRQAEIPVNGGNLIWIVNYLPASDRDGNIIGCAFTAVDITDRKKAEDKVNRQNEILKEIAWKQSHIVRAPLANILAIANLLENNIQDESLRCALKHETEKLDCIIRQIVDKTMEAKTEA